MQQEQVRKGMSPSKKAVIVTAGIGIALGLTLVVLWWNGILYDYITPQGKVVIWSYGFHPPEVVVKKGTTIVWENIDPVPHKIRSGSPSNPNDIFVSELLYQNDRFEHTFDETGTYEYYCVPHPLMKAKITLIP